MVPGMPTLIGNSNQIIAFKSNSIQSRQRGASKGQEDQIPQIACLKRSISRNIMNQYTVTSLRHHLQQLTVRL